jgi:hypothetical protein
VVCSVAGKIVKPTRYRFTPIFCKAGLRFVYLPRKAQEAIDWLTRQLAAKGKRASDKPWNALSALALTEKW